MHEIMNGGIFVGGVDPVTTGDPTIPFAQKFRFHHFILDENKVAISRFDHSITPEVAAEAFASLTAQLIEEGSGSIFQLVSLEDGKKYFGCANPSDVLIHGETDLGNITPR
jgi:hypothetical protein